MSAQQPSMGSKMEFPVACFTFARKDSFGRLMPQAVAHRGYTAKFAENTMSAFKAAIDVGAHGIETDIHLSKDRVVVLSHDPDLKRCFGRTEKIMDCDWEFLSKLKTLQNPHDSMPRLIDLLEYLAKPGLEEKWLLLDIKFDDDPEEIMRLIASAIHSVAPSPTKSWNTRIVLGCWAAKYVPLCSHYLPGFPITYIGFSIIYVHHYFSIPNMSFNFLQPILMTPFGRSLITKAHSQRPVRPVFAWTANDETRMRWNIEQGVDVVITDNPKLFLEIREGWGDGKKSTWGMAVWLDVVWINILGIVYGYLFQRRFGDKKVIRKWWGE
jgi:glycerophosphoryl diester phosphodiesterase